MRAPPAMMRQTRLSAGIHANKVVRGLEQHNLYWIGRLGGMRDMAMQFARWEKPEGRASTVRMAREYHRQMMANKHELRQRREVIK